MSTDNVELIRDGYEAFGRDGVDAILEFLDADIQVIPFDEAPGARSYQGHEGFRQYVADMREFFAGFGFEALELIDEGDIVIARTRFFGEGRGSGVPVELVFFVVWTVRDGRAVRARSYLDRDAALAAAAVTP